MKQILGVIILRSVAERLILASSCSWQCYIFDSRHKLIFRNTISHSNCAYITRPVFPIVVAPYQYVFFNAIWYFSISQVPVYREEYGGTGHFSQK